MRSDQMQAFTQLALMTFESEMADHCAELSPRLCELIGDAQLRAAIRLAIARAGAHGWTYRGTVRLYIEMTLFFGSAFDTDPQYPWIEEILAGSSADSQVECAERIFETMLDYLKQVHGPDDRFEQTALRRIGALVQFVPAIPADGFLPAMLSEIHHAFPEKAAYVSVQGLEKLVREGVAHARAHGVGTPQAATLFTLLMLAFGHGCLDDPLYPWIRRVLTEDKSMDSTARIAQLQKDASTWLEQVTAESSSAVRT